MATEESVSDVASPFSVPGIPRPSAGWRLRVFAWAPLAPSCLLMAIPVGIYRS